MDYSSIDFLQDLFELEREIREAPNTNALAMVITVRSQAVLGFKDAVFCAGSSARQMRAQAASNSDLFGSVDKFHTKQFGRHHFGHIFTSLPR